MIEPLGFYVLIEPTVIKEKTPGGIFLPESVRDKEQHAMARGEIIAAGKGAPSVQPHIGKTALFGRYAGVEVKEGGREFRLIDAQDVRAVI